MWLVLEYTPVGRYLYAIGANQRAAAAERYPNPQIRDRRLRGLRHDDGAGRYHPGLQTSDRSGQRRAGVSAARAGRCAFLGSTTIKPGRVNVWGTVVGVAILAVGISGIQQFGGSFWVEPLFNGVTLLIAIGIAGYAQRRKGAVHRAEDQPQREEYHADNTPDCSPCAGQHDAGRICVWPRQKPPGTARQPARSLPRANPSSSLPRDLKNGGILGVTERHRRSCRNHRLGSPRP